jgi:ribonuclease Y
MPGSYLYALGVGVVAVGFFLLGILVKKKLDESHLTSAQELAKRVIGEAEREADTKKREAVLEARDEWFRAKANFEMETKSKRLELERAGHKLAEREGTLEKRADLLGRKERELGSRLSNLTAKEKALRVKDERLQSLIEEQNLQLEKIAGMTTDEAKSLLMANLQNQAKHEAAQMVKTIKDRAAQTAQREAKRIITMAIQRCSAEHTVESTVSVVPLNNEDMKGRIIGREGRNIRAFETATGVDVIVDDTPEAVTLSAFDPIRREIARLSLERLLEDGRIHPAKIEEVVEKVTQEMNEMVRTAGEEAALEVGLGGLHSELVNLLGRLKYRTSYGQNVLQHCKETAFLAGAMAAELGLDAALSKRAGLLHDIGKAADHQTEGTHTEIGVDLARKYGEPQEVVNAIAAHHEDVEVDSPIAVLVQAADAVSGSRPGARRETLETYVKRLERLEEIADGFTGVEKTYAIQAGREIRIIVSPEKVSDAEAAQLAAEIARTVQDQLDYPGQVKVTVIRETRAVDYAR